MRTKSRRSSTGNQGDKQTRGLKIARKHEDKRHLNTDRLALKGIEEMGGQKLGAWNLETSKQDWQAETLEHEETRKPVD